MEYSAKGENQVHEEGIAINITSLYGHFSRLEDQRCRRGVRYALPIVLTMIMLAKLGGEDGPRGIAEWLGNRIEFLKEHMKWTRERAPHPVTISRILGKAINVEEFERLASAYFQGYPEAGRSVLLTIDGKTIRSTIPYGETHGMHLLAAYLPEEGLVLMQMEVDQKENEIAVAPRMLQFVDLQDKVVVGDALHTQRAISAQIVEAGGDYCWTVKDNQPTLRETIARFFEPELCTPGFGPAITDLRSTSRVNQGHGRTERRTLTAASVFVDELNWPYARQVFKLERCFSYHRSGKQTTETVFGITSLSPHQANPASLLSINRGYWGIENGLHYRRDVTLKEDLTRVKIGQAPRIIAIINNLVIGLIARTQFTYIPQARRLFAAKPDAALALILENIAP